MAIMLDPVGAIHPSIHPRRHIQLMIYEHHNTSSTAPLCGAWE